MPSRTFPTSVLQNANPGLSRLAAALGGGDQAYQQGYDAQQLGQSRMAQMLSQIDVNQAHQDKLAADAAQQRAETALVAKRPEQYLEQAALSTGATLPMMKAMQEFTRTGQMPMVDGVGPMPDGSSLRVPAVAPEQESRLAQALVRFAPVAMNGKDFKIDDWAQAQGAYRNQDLRDDVLAGRRTAPDVAISQAAVAGKPLYNAEANGSVLDLFRGALDTNNPMAKSTIGLKGAQATQARAAADEHVAGAAKKRAETAEGVNRYGMKAPVGYRWTADGTAQEPIPGGPADPATKGAKLAKPPTEGQSKALLFGSRMAVADEILNELASAGTNRPSVIKQGVEAVPLVGGLGGAIANNVFANPAQQQVEQAQRDFVNAVLRRESGAAISEGEFSNARKQYFPQLGDSPQVISQKAANRRTAIAGFKAEFGEPLQPNFDQIVGEARVARSPQRGKKPLLTSTSANKSVAVDY